MDQRPSVPPGSWGRAACKGQRSKASVSCEYNELHTLASSQGTDGHSATIALLSIRPIQRCKQACKSDSDFHPAVFEGQLPPTVSFAPTASCHCLALDAHQTLKNSQPGYFLPTSQHTAPPHLHARHPMTHFRQLLARQFRAIRLPVIRIWRWTELRSEEA